MDLRATDANNGFDPRSLRGSQMGGDDLGVRERVLHIDDDEIEACRRIDLCDVRVGGEDESAEQSAAGADSFPERPFRHLGLACGERVGLVEDACCDLEGGPFRAPPSDLVVRPASDRPGPGDRARTLP